MDDLIRFLGDIADASRRESEPSRRIEKPPPQASGKPSAAAAAAKPAAPGLVQAPAPKRQDAHERGLTAAFADRSSLLRALFVVEALGVPPSLRPREQRGDVW